MPGDEPAAQACICVLLTRAEAALREVEALCAGPAARCGMDADGGAEGRVATLARVELLRALCLRLLALVRPLEVVTNTLVMATAVVDMQVKDGRGARRGRGRLPLSAARVRPSACAGGHRRQV